MVKIELTVTVVCISRMIMIVRPLNYTCLVKAAIRVAQWRRMKGRSTEQMHPSKLCLLCRVVEFGLGGLRLIIL